MAITSTSFLSKGSQVEVSSHEAGSNEAWYSATVIYPPPSTTSPNHTSSNSLVYVEYHNLLSEDGSSNRLREYANIAHVRPAPVSDTGPIDFQLNDLVDAFYRDGWWTGVITTVVDASNFAVTFQNRPDEIQFRCEDLRIHKEWICGRWFQPQKQDDMALRTTNNQTKQATPITAKELPVATSIMKRKRQDLDNNDKASPNDEIMNVDPSKKKKPPSVRQSEGFELEVNGTTDQASSKTENFSHEKKVIASEHEKKKARRGKISDPRHNMVAFIDETDKKMATYLDVAAFLRRSRIFYATTVECDAYQSIIDEFWDNAKKVEAEIHSTVQDKPIIISEEIIRKVLQFGDSKNDPVLLDEKLCKGCFLRMGYKGDINARPLSKAGLSPQFKYIVHMVVHCLSHRKGGYDDLLDYTLCATTALCLNLPFNFSKMVFENMLLNLNEGRWWMYPRFIQLIINDQHPDLKKEGEKVKQERMNSNSCSGLKSYRGTPPKFRKLFGHLLKEDYVAPTDNKWRKDDSDSDGERAREDAIMVKYVPTHIAKRRYLKIESQEEESHASGMKKRKKTPIVEVETSESEKDADVSSQDSESEMANVEYDRNKSRFVLKKREKVQVDPDDIDETYYPEQEASKKAEASKKSKGRTKTMPKRSKTPALIDVPSDDEPVQNVEVSDATFDQEFEKVTNGEVDLSKADDTLKTPSETQKSQKDAQEQVDPSQIFGTLPESLSGFDNLFVERKVFDDLKAVVDDQTVMIKSLAAENDRLRSENVEKQRRFEESENKRIAQAKLLDQHIKYFMVLEKRFDLDLAKESEDLIVPLSDKFDMGSGTNKELIFKANLELDMVEQDKGKNATNEAPINISDVKTTFRDQKLTCSEQEPKKLRQRKIPPKIFNLRKRR